MLSSPRSVASFGLIALALGLVAACAGPKEQDVLNGTPSLASDNGTTSGGTTSGGTTSGGTTTPTCGSAEDEPNDDEYHANKIDGTICGTISPQGDTDWLTFTLKPSTQSLALQFSGSVRLRVMVEGHGTTELTPNSAGAVPFVKNKPYYVQVAAFKDSQSSQVWQVTVVEK